MKCLTISWYLIALIFGSYQLSATFNVTLQCCRDIIAYNLYGQMYRSRRIERNIPDSDCGWSIIYHTHCHQLHHFSKLPLTALHLHTAAMSRRKYFAKRFPHFRFIFNLMKFTTAHLTVILLFFPHFTFSIARDNWSACNALKTDSIMSLLFD